MTTPTIRQDADGTFSILTSNGIVMYEGLTESEVQAELAEAAERLARKTARKVSRANAPDLFGTRAMANRASRIAANYDTPMARMARGEEIN